MKPEVNIEDYGTTPENPVLLRSIRAGYGFCDKLRSLDEDLEYRRRGSMAVEGFNKPVDAYDFKRFGNDFCSIYIYAYHSENIGEVPAPFFRLDQDPAILDKRLEEMGITEEEGGDPEELLEALYKDELEDPPSRQELFIYLVRNILNKHGITTAAAEHGPTDWTAEDQDGLMRQIDELGVSLLIEQLVLQEWENYKERIHWPHREFFIHSFPSSYHHSKLEPFLSIEEREKNEHVKEAYQKLVRVINRIQFFANEDVQERVESDLRNFEGKPSLLQQCNTQFCGLQLNADFSGRYNLHYWLDLDIFKMLTEKAVSTLLRSIYELTPELDDRVSCRSPSYDCEAWFKHFKDESLYEEEFRLIKAEDPGLKNK